MPLSVTLVPAVWTWEAGQREAIAYNVYGLPPEHQIVIAMRPGGWRVVRDALPEFDQGRLYSTAEEALAALKAWIEGGRETAKG